MVSEIVKLDKKNECIKLINEAFDECSALNKNTESKVFASINEKLCKAQSYIERERLLEKMDFRSQDILEKTNFRNRFRMVQEHEGNISDRNKSIFKKIVDNFSVFLKNKNHSISSDKQEKKEAISDHTLVNNEVDKKETIIPYSFVDKKMESIEEIFTSVKKLIAEAQNDFRHFAHENSKDINSLGSSIEKQSGDTVREVNSLKSFIRNELTQKDYLKQNDFSNEINRKLKDCREEITYTIEYGLKDLKEIVEVTETLPTQIMDIDKKLSALNENIKNISQSSNSSGVNAGFIPKEERAIRDLHKYMSDGMRQLESLSLGYISNIDNINNIEKLKVEHFNNIQFAKEQALIEGKRNGMIELAKSMAEKFPTNFMEMRDLFSEVLEMKYVSGDVLKITNENKNELGCFIDTEITLDSYEVITPAILLVDNTVILKAKVKLLADNANNQVSEISENEEPFIGIKHTVQDAILTQVAEHTVSSISGNGAEGNGREANNVVHSDQEVADQ